jgi:hypothetical protein
VVPSSGIFTTTLVLTGSNFDDTGGVPTQAMLVYEYN